jgi:FixJ family two-component response regulator
MKTPNITAAPIPLIACVDDDAPVREALEGLLQAFGFEVLTFASAEALLASDALDRVSCLITDMQLGGISGFQLQKRLIAINSLIPTIIITAFADEELRASSMDAGAIEFLLKPITAERILSAVNEALGRGGS